MPEQSPKAFTQANHRSLQIGVNKHHLVDRLFHNALFFHKYSKAISKLLRDADLDGMPRFQHFYGHILLEILIDKCLLSRNPELVGDFYALLAKVKMPEVEEFLKLKDLAEHHASFSEHFNRFLELRFLENYVEEGGVVLTISRIADKMHGYDLLSKSDQEKMQLVVNEGMTLIENEYLKIFQTIEDLCARDEIS